MIAIFFCLLLSFFSIAVAFHSKVAFKVNKYQISRTIIRDVPLELEGQLDPSKKWDVTLEFKGETKVISVSEGTCILELAEANFEG